MTQTLSNEFDELRGAILGAVIAPDDADYDRARAVWNADIERSPAAVAQCASAVDVAAALAWADRHGRPVTVRSGGHSVAGTSVADGALLIDLSPMRDVLVDPDARRARVGGGALLRDVDAATQAHGLAVPLGMIGHTGIGGLALGGGMGHLTPLHGLCADNLLGAEVVLADGRVVHASADEHPDLFWALRGGGGNFGVVTEFEFALHPLDPTIEFAFLFWPLEQGTEVLRIARGLIANLPEDLTVLTVALNAPPEPFVPEEHRFRPGYALLITGFGADVGPAHARVVAGVREALPPLFEMATPMPYVALQQMLDEGNAWGSYCYEKGCYIPELSDDAISVITEHVPRKSSPMSLTLFMRLDGQYCAVDEDATAFGGGRTPRLGMFIYGYTPDPEVIPVERAWVRAFHTAMEPLAIGRETYVNVNVGEGSRDDHLTRDIYGAAKFERLARVKAQYDPGDVFHGNVEIKPGGTS